MDSYQLVFFLHLFYNLCFGDKWLDAVRFTRGVKALNGTLNTDPSQQKLATGHAGCIAAGVVRAFSCVCLSVCALNGKRLELSTPNLVHIYSTVVTRHAST